MLYGDWLMLTVEQLAERIEEYRSGSMSLSAFEDWFCDQSWNIHQTKKQNEIDAVFAVEAALARRHSDGLDEQHLKLELDNAIRPFVLRRQVRIVALSSASPQEIQLGNAPNRKKARSETVSTVRWFAQGM